MDTPTRESVLNEEAVENAGSQSDALAQATEALTAAPPSDPGEKRYLSAQYLQKARQASVEPDELQTALTWCEAAIRNDPTWEECHFLHGLIFDLLGDTDNAVLAYREALRLNPYMEIARQELIEAQSEQLDENKHPAAQPFQESGQRDPLLAANHETSKLIMAGCLLCLVFVMIAGLILFASLGNRMGGFLLPLPHPQPTATPPSNVNIVGTYHAADGTFVSGNKEFSCKLGDILSQDKLVEIQNIEICIMYKYRKLIFIVEKLRLT